MAEDTRGVFTLKTVRNNILNNEFVTPDEAFFAGSTESPNVSYWAGGTTPSEVSSIDKLTFDNDTTALLPGSNLTAVRSTHGGFSSKNSGYFLGGRTPRVSSVDKLSYQSESVSKSPASNLNQVIQDARGTASETHGYSTGGYNGSSYVSTVNKLIFSVDTSFQSPSASLITQRNTHGALGNQTYCYLTNGYDGSGYVNSCDRIVFGTDTTSRIPATFPGSRGGVTGASTDTIGYMSGGVEPGPIFYSTVNKFTFSTETTGTLPSANSLPASLQNNGGSSTPSLGYFGGGKGSGSAITTMCKINSSDDTRSNVPGANLTATRYNFSAVTPRGFSRTTTGYFGNTQNLKGEPQGPNAGYITMGASNISTINRTDYTTDVTFLIPATLTAARAYGSAVGSKTNIYFSTGTGSTVTDRLTYATETSVRVPGANTINQHYDGACAENAQKTFGYLIMGQNPPTSNVEKIQYSTETYAAVPGAALNSRRHLNGSSGANNNGYAYAGYTGSAGVSEIQRTNFTTDTSQVLTTKLGATGWAACATGNSTDGYTSSVGANTNVFRLNYATETSSTFSQLPAARSSGGGAGNQFNGYLSGGSPDPALKSNVDKIDYVSGTTLRLPSSAFLSFAQYGCTANTGFFKNSAYQQQTTPTLGVTFPTSTPNTGYVAGGGPGPKTSYEKLSYSTETQNIVPGQNLTISRGLIMGGTSSSTAGYSSGGYNGGTRYSTTDKITYSTDTATGVPGAALTGTGRYGHATSSSSSAGYNVGGYTTGAIATADKTTFSSDTTAALPSSANLSATRYYYQGGGGPNAGYFSMGVTPSRSSSTDKLVYSTDTTSIIPSANMPDQRAAGSGVANSYGVYFAGGNDAGSNFPTPGYRIDYSTDTQRTIGGVLNVGRYYLQSFGNELAGYWTGGQNPGGEHTWTNKLTYSTEVGQLVPTAYQTTTRSGGSGQSARTNGVVAGVPNIL
jgi:hypothetical protein